MCVLSCPSPHSALPPSSSSFSSFSQLFNFQTQWTWQHILLLIVSILSWFLVAIVINVSVSLSSFDWYGVFFALMSTGDYWMTLLWLVVLLCGWETFVDGVRRAFFFEPLHILQEVRLSSFALLLSSSPPLLLSSSPPLLLLLLLLSSSPILLLSCFPAFLTLASPSPLTDRRGHQQRPEPLGRGAHPQARGRGGSSGRRDARPWPRRRHRGRWGHLVARLRVSLPRHPLLSIHMYAAACMCTLLRTILFVSTHTHKSQGLLLSFCRSVREGRGGPCLLFPLTSTLSLNHHGGRGLPTGPPPAAPRCRLPRAGRTSRASSCLGAAA